MITRGPFPAHDRQCARIGCYAKIGQRSCIEPPSCRSSQVRLLKGSIILTTNRGVGSWGEIFDDTTIALTTRFGHQSNEIGLLVAGVVAIALLWSVLKRFEPPGDDREESAHAEASRESTTV